MCINMSNSLDNGEPEKEHADDNHESNHEFNMFLDREIQRKLLELSENLAKEEMLSTNSTYSTSQAKPRTGNSTSRGKNSNLQYEKFCAWNERGSSATRDNGTTNKKGSKLSRERDSSNNIWKDFKPKDIHYIFKHYGDTTRYIEQYRYEHTYNFGPLSREPIEITTCKIVPLRETPSPSYTRVSDVEHYNPFRRMKDLSSSHQSLNNIVDQDTISNTTTTDTLNLAKKLKFAKSEPNIAELSTESSYRYRLSPHVVSSSKESSKTYNINNKENIRVRNTKSKIENNVSIIPATQIPTANSESVDSVPPISKNGANTISTTTRPDSGKNKNGLNKRPSSNKTNSSDSRLGSKGTSTMPKATVALDTVTKMSPLQILQVKKSGQPLPTGLPLFQGRTMKVAPSEIKGDKMPQVKSGPLIQSMILPHQNMKTMDVLTNVSAIEPNQDKKNDNENPEQQQPTTDNGENNNNKDASSKYGLTSMKETSITEASQNLKKGTDKENYQSLISELSFLDISTEENVNKALEMFPSLDVTGLTVSFAQKYAIGQMNGSGEVISEGGVRQGGSVIEKQKDVQDDDVGLKEEIVLSDGSGGSKDGSNNEGLNKENGNVLVNGDISSGGGVKTGVKVLGEVNNNLPEGVYDDDQDEIPVGNIKSKPLILPEVQLEKVSKNYTRNEEIKKINDLKIKLSINKKKETLSNSRVQFRKAKSSVDDTRWGQIRTKHQEKEDTDHYNKQNQYKIEEYMDREREREKSRVTFNMEHEIIDFLEDDDEGYNVNRHIEISSPDIMKPVPLLPYLDDGGGGDSSNGILSSKSRQSGGSGSRNPFLDGPLDGGSGGGYKSPAISRSIRDITPDKASIMRRYFMDIAEKEGNDRLLERLQGAPDRNFKPSSAGDGERIRYRVSLDEAVNNATSNKMDEKTLSSSCGSYVYASSSLFKPSIQHYSKLKGASRQKSFFNPKPDLVAESDKKFLKDLGRLSKLKEIYLKSREKTNGKIDGTKGGKGGRGVPKENISVLHKMQTGQQEVDGIIDQISYLDDQDDI